MSDLEGRADVIGKGRLARARRSRYNWRVLVGLLSRSLSAAANRRDRHRMLVRVARQAIQGAEPTRRQDEYTEIGPTVRIIIASGFGFVITSDAIGVCVRRHIEIIITDYAQSFTAIYAPYAPCLPNRACLAMRMRQFAAVVDRSKKLRIVKDMVRRKIIVEHNAGIRVSFLNDLSTCKTVETVRHVEARSAQEWWRKWKDFEVNFIRGLKPPEQWRTFETKYIGRVQGKSGELPRQFTARFVETPLQALHNFAAHLS